MVLLKKKIFSFFAQMHEDVREMTLAARVLETALGKEAAKLREKFEKSKEGMDHATWKKVEAHEEAARAEIMNKVLVVACTCVTAGTMYFQCQFNQESTF